MFISTCWTQFELHSCHQHSKGAKLANLSVKLSFMGSSQESIDRWIGPGDFWLDRQLCGRDNEIKISQHEIR